MYEAVDYLSSSKEIIFCIPNMIVACDFLTVLTDFFCGILYSFHDNIFSRRRWAF